MKKLILFWLIVVFVMVSSVVFAQEKALLGNGNMAFKVDYISFTDSDLEDADVESGLYLGLEGFVEVAPKFYIGLEVGHTSIDSNFFDFFDMITDVTLTYIPVEVNLKYAAELSPNLIIDFGGGISYNYAEIEVESVSEDEWLLGGQLFVDLNYTFDTFFLGINGKYQLTEEGDDLVVNFDNWRIGGQIGFRF